jgi:gamma-tubulin complex component 4
MLAEILLLLAGHQSSLFPTDHTLHPAFTHLLHPGEQQCLESLALIALQYRTIKSASARLARTPSRYVAALCSRLDHILRDEYEALVVHTEAQVLKRDAAFVGAGSFVPFSSIRATFAGWEAPLAALVALMERLEAEARWAPGPLVDMLMQRARTGVHRVADILERLSVAVQRVWRTQLVAFLVHGTLAAKDPLATKDYALLEGSTPKCVSPQSRDSIAYIGRAVATVKAAKWQRQLPRTLAMDYTKMLESVLPEDQHAFDRTIVEIRSSVGEWLWMNVLTRQDVDDAVDSL